VVRIDVLFRDVGGLSWAQRRNAILCITHFSYLRIFRSYGCYLLCDRQNYSWSIASFGFATVPIL